jgi:hypothetical protein
LSWAGTRISKSHRSRCVEKRSTEAAGWDLAAAAVQMAGWAVVGWSKAQSRGGVGGVTCRDWVSGSGAAAMPSHVAADPD